jgi:tetratricopeptide (TPR) repeat protein
MATILGLMLTLLASRNATAAPDDAEKRLAEDVASLAGAELKTDLSQRDRAYVYFLLAVYRRDARSREKAREIYRALGTPEGRAFLGSIEILEARDAESVGFLGGLISPFKRFKEVWRGIDHLDAAVREHADNLDVRVVRMITYLELPSFFGKYRDGFDDMMTILRWIKEEKVQIPEEEALLRDQSSVYYYAGRYFLKSGQRDKAREMFLKSTKASPRSPFALAAGKTLLEMR